MDLHGNRSNVDGPDLLASSEMATNMSGVEPKATRSWEGWPSQAGQRARRLPRVMLLMVAISWVVVPLVYLFLNSIKPSLEFLSTPPTIFPSKITFEHYSKAFSDPKVSRLFKNTVLVTGITTLVTVVVGTFAAYGLSRLRLPAKWLGFVVFIFLFIRFYPRVTTVIPYFLTMRELDLLDTIWAIILGHLGITVPFVTWLLLIVFNELPKEIEEAAIIDGAGPWARLRYVLFPLVAPGVAAASILTAFLSWNEFLIASSVARREAQTLPIGVASFVTDQGVHWGPMSALAVVMILPMILFALLVQRHLISGLTFGAVKG